MNTNKIDLIKAEVARIQLYTQSEVLKQVLDYIDEVQKEEPVSEDLEEAAKEYSFIDGAGDIEEYARYDIKKYNSFKAGAEWGKNQAKVEIQAQSMALAHECPKESVCSLLA